jgi:hypothetical protein
MPKRLPQSNARTRRIWAVFPIAGDDLRRGWRVAGACHRPCSLRPRAGHLPFPRPSATGRGDGAPRDATSIFRAWRRGHVRQDVHAPRRSIAVSSGSRAALLAASLLRLLRTISELLAGGPNASGRGPAPPGSKGCVIPSPAGTASPMSGLPDIGPIKAIPLP